MHSTDTTSMSFAHNGDFSGRVLFSAPEGVEPPPGESYPDTGWGCQFAVEFVDLAAAALTAGDSDLVDVEATGADVATDQTFVVRLPVLDLRELVGHRVISERISALESMEAHDAYALAVEAEVTAWASAARRR